MARILPFVGVTLDTVLNHRRRSRYRREVQRVADKLEWLSQRDLEALNAVERAVDRWIEHKYGPAEGA
jgi:hypothetical protein